MYQLEVPEVPYGDPWASSFQQEIRRLAGSGRRIAFYYDETNSSSFRYRVYNIIQAFIGLNLPIASGYFVRQDLLNAEEILKLADMIVICRSKYTSELASFILRSKNRGIPVLFDVDDLVFDTRFVRMVMDTLGQPSREVDYDFWFAYFARQGEIAKLCDGGITTNAFLAQRLQQFMQVPVHVIPNFLNREQIELSERIYTHKAKRKFERSNLLHVGYFSGTPSHRKDLDIILDALAHLMKMFPHLVLRLAGYIELPNMLRPFGSRVEYVPFTDFVNLQRVIGATEINLVPLQDNEFTNCKSELKYFEAGIVGTLTVATPIFSYRQCIENGSNGFLATSYQWYDVLSNIIRDFEATQSLLPRAREQSLERYAWYNQGAALSRVFLNLTTS